MLSSLFSDLKGSIIAFVSFAIARKFSGGLHLKSLTACAIISALIFVVIPLIHLSHKSTLIITGITAVVFLLFSPNTLEEVNTSKIEPYLKLISTVIVMTNFIIQSPIIALSFAAQALLLPWKGGVINEKGTCS